MQIAASSLVNDANLVAYWKLENVSDSKNGFTLTNNNGVTFPAGKYANCALVASSSSQFLSIVNSLGIGTGAFSVSLWVKIVSQPTSNQAPFWTLRVPASGLFLRMSYQYSGGIYQLFFKRDKAGSSNPDLLYTHTLSTTIFEHLVMTYDGSTLRQYLNGVMVNSASTSGTGTPGGAAWTGIGNDNDVNVANAYIDDVGVFTHQLTDLEVQTLYTETGSLFFGQL